MQARSRTLRNQSSLSYGVQGTVGRGTQKEHNTLSKSQRKLKLVRCFSPVALVVALSTSTLAVPIVYTGFLITDGKIGTLPFHNARVILTFVSDTAHVKLTTLEGVSVAYNATGTAHVTIVGDKLKIQATLAANQIFVSLDQTNGGVGFGSFAPDGSLQQAYPLGVSRWMVQGALPAGSYLVPSAEEASLSTDLMHRTSFSGIAYSCVAFPLPYGLTCPPPKNPLKTDKGDFYLYEPYQYRPTSRTVNVGFFFADLGTSQLTLPANIYTPSSLANSGPMTYHAFLFGDVKLGGTLYKAAKVLLTFVTNSRFAQPLPGTDPDAHINRVGTADVAIMQGSKVVNATFSANQIYVYVTPAAFTMGFGSNAWGRGYPLALGNDSCLCEQEINTVSAVSDILDNPADTNQYTPKVATLVTNLKNRTALGGGAYSCSPFTLPQNGCPNISSPPKLTTDKGDFYLYEPYTENYFWSPPYPVSLNSGLFWSTFN